MANQEVAFDAIAFEPVILKMSSNPRVLLYIYPPETFWVRLDPHAESLPDTVLAVGIFGDQSYFGYVPTSHIGIGCQNAQVHFEEVES